MLLVDASSVNSIAQLLTVIAIFVVVLALTYFVTRWTGNYQKGKMANTHVEVLESTRIAPNKYIEIVRVAGKILVLGIGKDTVTMLTELDEQTYGESFKCGETQGLSFKDILQKFGGKDSTAPDETSISDHESESFEQHMES
ncbi:MAG: flagellar biosynthetic protein FliO [Lachnospiraceae bacterium]|nr:flagellar biosynthetic protein FliO [Lachnospiraceae bacterium]